VAPLGAGVIRVIRRDGWVVAEIEDATEVGAT